MKKIRPMTMKQYKKMEASSMRVHETFHGLYAYLKRFPEYCDLQHGTLCKTVFTKNPIPTKRQYRVLNPAKIHGYRAMLRVKRYAQKHPKEVIECHVDDAFHAGSSVFLIAHRDRKSRKGHWMGVTALYIPQCTTQQNEFFLYPGDLQGLIAGLQQMQKLQGKDEDV
jgi:hypothetical protein